MKNITIIFLFVLLTHAAFAQHEGLSYPLTQIPKLDMRFSDSLPAVTREFMQNERPCTIEVHLIAAGDTMDFLNLEVEIENGKGTVAAVPGNPNQFVVTPMVQKRPFHIRMLVYINNPNDCLMVPIRKPDMEGRVYDETGKVVPDLIAGWQPLENDEKLDGRYVFDYVPMWILK